MAQKKNENIDFEKAINELNLLVEKMEHGGLSLEESLQCFEKGVLLTRKCQNTLKDAEQKIKILMENNLKNLADSEKEGDEDE